MFHIDVVPAWVFFQGTLSILEEESHIKDVLSRIIVEMIKREWPQQWPDMLKEMEVLTSQGVRNLYDVFFTISLIMGSSGYRGDGFILQYLLCLPKQHLFCLFILLVLYKMFISRDAPSTGNTDRTGDADLVTAGRGRDLLPDVAGAAAQRHPAETHPEHGQHLQVHDDHSASECGRAPETGQRAFILFAKNVQLEFPRDKNQPCSVFIDLFP